MDFFLLGDAVLEQFGEFRGVPVLEAVGEFRGVPVGEKFFPLVGL